MELTGPRCTRRGCERPRWKDGLCARCWRFAKVFGKQPRMLAYEPLDGYRDDRDSVALPRDQWEREAEERGMDIAELLARKREGDGDGERPWT